MDDPLVKKAAVTSRIITEAEYDPSTFMYVNECEGNGGCGSARWEERYIDNKHIGGAYTDITVSVEPASRTYDS